MLIPKLLNPPLDPSSGVLIYGAGKTGRFVLEECRKIGIPIVAVMDRNPTEFSDGTTFYQYPFYPKELRNHPVIVAIHGELLNAWAQLREAGFPLLYTMSQFYLFAWHNYHYVLPNYCCPGSTQDNLTEMDSYQQEISAAYNLLEDNISRTNFHNQIYYRRTGNVQYIQEPDPGLQYYSDNRPFHIQRPINFVDCGAFTGDTLQELAAVLEFESITAFEPDPEVFQILRKYLAKNRLSDRIITIPGGVGNHNEVLSFHSSQDGGATFGHGELKVPVFALDSLLCSCRVDFIKMDIEGSEAEALHGAQDIIHRESPILAISVYHKPADLWKIPLLIKQIYPASHLFLRSHHGSYHDTVCYAVPDRFLRTQLQ